MSRVPQPSSSLEFPMRRECPFAAPPRYAELRAQEPVRRVTLPGGRVAWLLFRHADVRAVLGHPQVSSNPKLPNFPEPELLSRSDEPRAPSLIEMDPPQHGVYRRMLTGEFSVHRIAAMRPFIQRTADRLVEELLRRGPPVELVETFALPLPSLTICHLLGVPEADHPFIEARTRNMVSAPNPEEVMAVLEELSAYLDGLIREKERQPTEDLLGRLILQQVRKGALTHEELVSNAVFLLAAGHETTANMISLGVVTLLQHPEQLAQLRAEPSLTANTVEELLRFHSIGDAGAVRVALADLEVGGQLIRAGEGLIPLLLSANRDEAVFPRPDTLDLRRHTRGHMGFGFGVHQCVGQNLARAELEIAYHTLFTRLPGLRLDAPLEALSFKYEEQGFGLNALPVAW